MLALVISALISLGVISSESEYSHDLLSPNEAQIEQELQMDIIIDDITEL